MDVVPCTQGGEWLSRYKNSMCTDLGEASGPQKVKFKEEEDPWAGLKVCFSWTSPVPPLTLSIHGPPQLPGASSVLSRPKPSVHQGVLWPSWPRGVAQRGFALS